MISPIEPKPRKGPSRVDFQAIGKLIREVGEYQLGGYRTLAASDVTVKDDTSYGYTVVTEYDEESERRVFEFIQENYPGHSFLGEEHGNVLSDPSHYWILDPIDGTSNFTQGIPFWGPSLCYWTDGAPARAWVYFPALDQMFYAARGEGAFLNGQPIQASQVREYTNLVTVASVSRLHRKFRLTCPAKHRILGSIIVNLCYLATGSFAATYCRGNIWDIAAGLLIAQEAGALIECEPLVETLDLATLTPKNAESISVYGMANPELPHFSQFLEILEDPVEGR